MHRENLTSAVPESKKGNFSKLILIGLGILSSICIIVVTVIHINNINAYNNSGDPYVFESGSQGVINKDTMVSDRENGVELANQVDKGDINLRQRMAWHLSQDNYFKVKAGIKVRVLEQKAEKVRLLILEGPQNSRTGWVICLNLSKE